MNEVQFPKVVIVFGLPGAGKSFFASALAEVMRAEYISSDRLGKNLISHRIYSEEEKRLVYNKMLAAVEELVELNKSVVVDGTFYKKDIRDTYLNSLNGKADVLFIEVYAVEDLIKKRLAKSRPYTDANYNVYKYVKDAWEPLANAHLMLESTDRNLSKMLSEALNYCSHYDQLSNQ